MTQRHNVNLNYDYLCGVVYVLFQAPGGVVMGQHDCCPLSLSF